MDSLGNFQFSQLVLRVRQTGISEDDQIAALQQIIILTINAENVINLTKESGAIEASSLLLSQSQNPRIKQLCAVLIGIIGQLEVSSIGELDWTSVCSSLVALLLSSDEGITQTGKVALICLIERSENAVNGLMQINFADNAAQTLLRSLNAQSSSSSSSSTSLVQISSSIVMSILEVIDKLMTVASEKIQKSSKIQDALQQLKKQGSQKAIKQKARMLLSVFESEEDEQDKKQEGHQDQQQINKQLKELQMKLNESEQKKKEEERRRISAEEQTRKSQEDKRQEEMKKKQAEENVRLFEDRIRILEREKRESFEKLRIVEEQKKQMKIQKVDEERIRVSEQRLRQSEESRRYAEQKKIEAEERVRNSEQRLRQLEYRIQTAEQGKRQSDENYRIAENSRREMEMKKSQVEQSKRQVEERMTQLEGQLKESEVNKRNADERIRIIEQQMKDNDKRTQEADQQKRIEYEQEKQQLSEQIRIQEVRVIENESRKIKIEQKLKLFGEEVEQLLKCLNNPQFNIEIKKDDWIQMKNDLEQEETGNDQQQQEIIINKRNTCQKIITLLIGGINDERKKQAIECGIVDALIHFLSIHPLERIQVSHIWAFFIFTYSNDEINKLLYSKKPYSALFRLIDHSDVFIINRVIGSIFNILIDGSSSTKSTSPHPHIGSIQACDGINKLFSLFDRNMSQYSKDRSSICISHLFRGHEILNIEQRNKIITHLISIINASDVNSKFDAKDALSYLAQNDANFREILNNFDINKIVNDLNVRIEGKEEQVKWINSQIQDDCIFLLAILEHKEEDQIRQLFIQSGIIEAFLNTFMTNELNSITSLLTHAFYVLTNPSNDETKLLIYKKKPYQPLIHLLDHSNTDVIEDAVLSIFNLISSGAASTESKSHHPHFTVINENNGIQQLFKTFKSENSSTIIKDTIAIIIGFLYRSREIVDNEMKLEIFTHLKSLLNDSDDWTMNYAKLALQYLSQNSQNRTMIQKGGFVLPK
ncbi:MAG: hypothetical protein EZS28_003831 [Streblomastix strix]|uniref:Uncharacterized protein n=1 Tax=Streblomastix strix TaxID=222440 RepID=A0A5J4X0H5_9EUKA|nr:MAG: hypothetical protein EZS28_003831 [Streblomastix strix]